MTTSIPAGAARVMNWHTVAELEAAGDVKTLANALRNLITITDHATSAAQSAANARQEYVPTTLHKDDLYRAMDTALHGEPYDPLGRALYIEDEDDLPEPDPAEGNDYRPLARALQAADDQWSYYADSDDYDPEDETNTYTVFVAKVAQSMLDADAVARAKPVEVRGPGSEESELARRAAQINQLAAANQRLRDRVEELVNATAEKLVATSKLTDQLRAENAQLRAPQGEGGEAESNIVYPVSVVASRPNPGMVTFLMHGAPSFSVNAVYAREKVAKPALFEADVAERLWTEHAAKAQAEQAGTSEEVPA